MIQKILDNKIVRYFFSAGLATGVDVAVYFITFNFIYQKQDVHFFRIVTLSAPTASLMFSYTCGLITNFLITKYLVFTESDLRGVHQLARYVVVALFVLAMNYFMMSFLIKVLDWYPTIARVFSALSIGVLSFVIHKFYSFKVTKK
ncbi:MAG: GtrA family protein [Bacteroidetes bacterium]|nr:GtrA family protein [Bacteroidota bacterium]